MIDEQRIEANLTVNLLENTRFKEFINAFTNLSKGSETLSLTEIRDRCTRFFLPPETIYESVKKVENIEVLGNDNHSIPCRIYIPESSAKTMPVIIYFHRGGWVFGSIEECEPICRKLANRFGCIVAAVGYRHAPEFPFPKPVEDCYAATQWIATNSAEYGGDPHNMIICGESAGANMATVVARMCRDRKGAKITKQLLLCPVITSTIHEESYRNSADQYFITLESMKFFWSMYLQSPTDQNNPDASPEKSTDLSGLPPAFIVTAEYDPLAVEADLYCEKLKDAGVQVTQKCFPEVIHCFIDLPIYDEGQKNDWIDEIRALVMDNK